MDPFTKECMQNVTNPQSEIALRTQSKPFLLGGVVSWNNYDHFSREGCFPLAFELYLYLSELNGFTLGEKKSIVSYGIDQATLAALW